MDVPLEYHILAILNVYHTYNYYIITYISINKILTMYGVRHDTYELYYIAIIWVKDKNTG